MLFPMPDWAQRGWITDVLAHITPVRHVLLLSSFYYNTADVWIDSGWSSYTNLMTYLISKYTWLIYHIRFKSKMTTSDHALLHTFLDPISHWCSPACLRIVWQFTAVGSMLAVIWKLISLYLPYKGVCYMVYPYTCVAVPVQSWCYMDIKIDSKTFDMRC